ncbi:MAG TPA: hypothetical protein VLA51_14075 [Paracoccaceae bacterium]|nr:hypothetical protein [Paracoccaceae bacterium]
MGRLKVFPECDSGGDGLRLRALRQVVGELRFQEIAEEATYRFSAALLEMKNAANAQDLPRSVFKRSWSVQSHCNWDWTV